MLQSPPWTILDPKNPNRHGVKRKTDVQEESFSTTPPVKRFLTEEEMSSDMSRLHIEGNCFSPFPTFPRAASQPSFPETSKSPFVFNRTKFTGFGETEQDQEMDLEPVKELPRLYISEEVSNIKLEPVLPPSIINLSFNNQMALVPWVPRPAPPLADDTEADKTEEVDDMDLMNVD